MLDFAHAPDPDVDLASSRSELQTIADQVDDDLQDSVLVAPEAHIFDPTHTRRAKRWQSPVRAGSLGAWAHVHSFRPNEADGEVDSIFPHLFVKDG
jgi:hypothetical protein